MRTPQLPLRLIAASVAGFMAAPALATPFIEFSDQSGNNDPGTLAHAALAENSGISIVDLSVAFQGNLGLSSVGGDIAFGDGYGGDGYGDGYGFIDDGCGGCESGYGGGYGGGFGDGTEFFGSASQFENLDLDPNGLSGENFNIGSGILLSSGAGSPPSENTRGDFSGSASGLGDAGLDSLLEQAGFEGESTEDATVLSFDFTVDEGVNAVLFDYIFGTEEFPTEGVLDIAGVFIDGVNYTSLDNAPLLFDIDNPSADFFDNSFEGGEGYGGEFEVAAASVGGDGPVLDIEYDGITPVRQALGLLDMSLDVHTIKIAVSDTSDDVFDSGLFFSNLRATDVQIDPDDIDGNGGFVFNLDVGEDGVGLDPTRPIFIDPFVATGYTYTSTSIAIEQILLPVIGDNAFDVFAFNTLLGDFELLGTAIGGTFFDLSLFASTNLDFTQLQVTGIETSAALDPNDPNAFITGLVFAGGGSTTVTQTAIQTFVPDATVPAPGPLALLGAGLAGLAMRLRRKRNA